MKKYLLLILVFGTGLFAWAAEMQWRDSNGNVVPDKVVNEAFEKDFVEALEGSAREVRPAYYKLMTCTPYDSEMFKIYGMRNDKCHYEYSGIDCNVPLGIAKKVGAAGARLCRSLLIDGNFSTESEDNKYIKSILDNKLYCKSTNNSIYIEEEF